MKKETICLITGGRWHYGAYNFLSENHFEIVILDDNKNCYLKKTFKNTKIDKLKNISKYKNLFFWSPCNDLGAHLADKMNNKKFFVRTKNFMFSNNKKKISQELKISKLLVKKINKNKNYIKKPIFGSGSKGISIYNGKNLINKNKYFLQELILGNEISVEIYSFKGKHKILSISLRILKGFKSAVCIINLDINSKLKNIIKKKINQYYKKLGVINGISHLEAIIDKQNRFYPIDINLRMGGAGVSDYLIKETISNDPFELDFNTLKYNFKAKKLAQVKYGMIVYEYLNNNYLKNNLENYSKLGKHVKLLPKSQITRFEVDKNRLSMLFIKKKNLKQIINSIKFIFQSNKAREIISKINTLS